MGEILGLGLSTSIDKITVTLCLLIVFTMIFEMLLAKLEAALAVPYLEMLRGIYKGCASLYSPHTHPLILLLSRTHTLKIQNDSLHYLHLYCFRIDDYGVHFFLGFYVRRIRRCWARRVFLRVSDVRDVWRKVLYMLEMLPVPSPDKIKCVVIF